MKLHGRPWGVGLYRIGYEGNTKTPFRHVWQFGSCFPHMSMTSQSFCCTIEFRTSSTWPTCPNMTERSFSIALVCFSVRSQGTHTPKTRSPGKVWWRSERRERGLLWATVSRVCCAASSGSKRMQNWSTGMRRCAAYKKSRHILVLNRDASLHIERRRVTETVIAKKSTFSHKTTDRWPVFAGVVYMCEAPVVML